MEPEKKKQQLKVLESSFRDAAEQCCESSIEAQKEGFQSNLESWDTAAAKKRAKIQQNLQKVIERFARGYRALLEELSRDSQQGKGPHGNIRP